MQRHVHLAFDVEYVDAVTDGGDDRVLHLVDLGAQRGRAERPPLVKHKVQRRGQALQQWKGLSSGHVLVDH